MPFTVSQIETSASQMNGKDRFVHHGSGQQICSDQAGHCLPMMSGQRVHEHGSASSVGSVASSAKLAVAGSVVNRPSRCASLSSDIASSLAVNQLDEVLNSASISSL